MNIEQFVNDYLQEHHHDVLLCPYNALVEFADSFKKKMMKEAVEGVVDFEYFGYKVIRPDLKQLDALLESMNHGDKVRIIIVKED
jgi:hypothetical protein